jgi:adenosylcobinamide-phosphate synthase
MGFIALILALTLEQLRPLPRNNVVHRAASSVADWIAATTDAGRRQHGVIGWLLAIVSAMLAVVLAQVLLEAIHPVLVLALHVVVVYFTIGFRQFSHAFTEIQLGLAANDPEGARGALQRWIRRQDPSFVAADLSVTELCRVAISHALIEAHRHVFGPLFWYILLPGATGPILYRGAQFLAARWSCDTGRSGESERLVVVAGRPSVSAATREPGLSDTEGVPYGWFADQAYRWLDWLPVRLAAAGFAIVGNFEDAVYCWRAASAVHTGESQRRILLMTGSGALGVRLADPTLEADMRGAGSVLEAETEEGTASPGIGSFEWSGVEPDASSLRSAVGLVWRSVVLWILLFSMLTIANWLGR